VSNMRVEASKLHRLFYPQVPLVLAAKFRDRVSAMPVVSYASVSDSPPLIAVACAPKTFTYRLCSRAHVFSLSLLDSSKVKQMESLVKVRGGDVEDKLLEVGLQYSAGKAVDVPVIADAVASIECSVDTKRKTGDHALLIGRVEACDAIEDFSDFWGYRSYRPILYTGWRGRMTVFASAIGAEPAEGRYRSHLMKQTSPRTSNHR